MSILCFSQITLSHYFFSIFPPDLNRDTSYEEGKIPKSFDAEQGFKNVKIKFPTSTVFSSSKQGKILFPKATSSEPLDKAKGSEEICSLNVSDQRTETRLLDPSLDTNNIGYFYDKTEYFTENEKYDNCRKIWRPVATFTFPQSIIYGKKGNFPIHGLKIINGFNILKSLMVPSAYLVLYLGDKLVSAHQK